MCRLKILTAESLGASVTWDAANNAIVITSDTPLAVEEKKY